MNLFSNKSIEEIKLESIFGGENGKSTHTTECTWHYVYTGGSSETKGDTDNDGDWIAQC